MPLEGGGLCKLFPASCCQALKRLLYALCLHDVLLPLPRPIPASSGVFMEARRHGSDSCTVYNAVEMAMVSHHLQLAQFQVLVQLTAQ